MGAGDGFAKESGGADTKHCPAFKEGSKGKVSPMAQLSRGFGAVETKRAVCSGHLVA